MFLVFLQALKSRNLLIGGGQDPVFMYIYYKYIVKEKTGKKCRGSKETDCEKCSEGSEQVRRGRGTVNEGKETETSCPCGTK